MFSETGAAEPLLISPRMARITRMKHGVLLLDFHFGFDGVGDEALLVGLMVKVLLVFSGRQFIAAVGYARVERHGTYPVHASLILRNVTDGLVDVAVQLEALA
jgi:hypothetical protein